LGKFDKYMLSQLLVLFGFFSLVLVLVYWVNRAVILFDQLIANGHSAMVFLEFTVLSLPAVIAIVLPMAAFAAVVYVTNRLASESELVVVQATGYSPWRLARPVLAFGVIVAVLVSILGHVLVPAASGQMAQRRAEIQSDMAARLLREGTFLHPVPGVTFYIGEITPEGELRNVFLADSRAARSRTNYSAARAFMVGGEEGPKLIMLDGMSQELRRDDNRLFTTSFTDFVFDLSELAQGLRPGRIAPQQMSTAQLLWPTPEVLEQTGASRAALLQRGHSRIALATLSVVAVMTGFATLLIGGFSRFGLWRQILAAVVILIVLKSLDNYMNGLARNDEALWPLVYLSSAAGLILAGAMLWLSARPALFIRKRQAGA
jgi:lipopolysaccharide export system permease protein